MTGYNHNPEYFRWMRETGQQIARNPYERNRQVMCGVILDDYTITSIIGNVFQIMIELSHSFSLSIDAIDTLNMQ